MSDISHIRKEAPHAAPDLVSPARHHLRAHARHAAVGGAGIVRAFAGGSQSSRAGRIFFAQFHPSAENSQISIILRLAPVWHPVHSPARVSTPPMEDDMYTIDIKHPLEWIVVPHGLVSTGNWMTGQTSFRRHAMCGRAGMQRTQVQGVGNGDITEILGRTAALR